MGNDELLKQAKINEKEIAELEQQDSKQREFYESKGNVLYSKYRKLKDNLEEEQRKEKDILEAKRNATIGVLKNQIIELNQAPLRVKRILQLKETVKEAKKAKHLLVISGAEKIDCLHESEFLVLDAYIADNGKPKNKFSLCVIGDSILPHGEYGLIKLPYDYGCNTSIKDNRYPSVKTTLKDAPTKEELTAWYGKNKPKILKEIIEQHKALEVEYCDVRDNYNSKAWEKAYWESRKKYYESWCRGEGKEKPEYKEALRQLEKLEAST